MKIDVLGTNYTVLIGARKDMDIQDGFMGECRIYSKQILVCTDKEQITDEELKVRVQEVVAHELLHAYLNEAGVDISCGDEEKMCDFYMKNWWKLHKSILEVLEVYGFNVI